MLKKLYIDNFRNFKNFTFEPNYPHTLLCGLNGTGKTTILEIISKLQYFLLSGAHAETLCSIDDIPRWEKSDYGNFKCKLGVQVEVNKTMFSYEIVIAYEFKNYQYRIEKELLSIDSKNIFVSELGNATGFSDDDKQFKYPVDWAVSGLLLSSRTNSKIRVFLSYIERNIFSLSISPYEKIDYLSESGTLDFLQFTGVNFQSWYSKRLDENLSAVAKTFNDIKPFIKGFKQFGHVKDGQHKELYAEITHKEKGQYKLHFNELSHGQKILSILYLVMNLCPKNSVICIDEFENFLSPIELQPLYNMIQDVYEEKNVQCILVSHHEKTLNWFQDCAIVFSHSYDNSFIQLKDFSEESKQGLSVQDYLQLNEEL